MSNQYLFGVIFQELCSNCPGAVWRCERHPYYKTVYRYCRFCKPREFNARAKAYSGVRIERYYLR